MSEKIDIGAIKKSLEEMDIQYQPRVRALKMVFGDPQTIHLLEVLKELALMEKEMERKLYLAMGGQKLSEDIIAKKKNVLWLIDQIEEKQHATA